MRKQRNYGNKRMERKEIEKKREIERDITRKEKNLRQKGKENDGKVMGK